MVGGFFCAVWWRVCLALSRCARFVRLRVKQLEAYVSKLCRVACRPIVEAIMENCQQAVGIMQAQKAFSIYLNVDII